MENYMYILISLLIILIVFFTILMIFKYKFTNKIEKFNNDNSNKYYYDYININTLPSSVYDEMTISNTQFSIEYNTQFFIDILNANKKTISTSYLNYKDEILNDNSILFNINDFIKNIFNKDLPSIEQYYFKNIYSTINFIKKINANLFIIQSRHVLYRDTKLYGISLTITTQYNTSDISIILIDYIIDGFIFQDKLNNTEPYSLIDNNYDSAHLEVYNNKSNCSISSSSPEYENKYLCDHYANIKREFGINVLIPSDLSC